MEILARIPDLSGPSIQPRPRVRGPTVHVTAPAAVPTPPRPPLTPTAPALLPASPGPTSTTAVIPLQPEIPRRRRDAVRPVFPATSIVLLAVVAGLIWTAVTWREHGTVFRRSPPERWSEAFASEPALEETDRLR